MSDSNPIRKINILGDLLFPPQFQFLGIALLLGGLAALTVNVFIGPIIILLALLIFTGRDGVVFYPLEKLYKPYRSFLFIKFGEKKPYQSIDMIYVNAGKYSQKIYTAHTMQHMTKKSIEYNAFVKLSDGEKLYLGFSKDKPKLIQRFNRIAEILGTSLQDNTDQ